MSTIHDVARKARVSVMTISRVLNKPEVVSPKTIEKVRKVMDDLGYEPSHVARSLVKRKTNTIGVMMPDIKNTFFNSWFRYVEDYAGRFGYTTLLCSTDEKADSEMKYVRFFQAHRVDGILMVPHAEDSARYLIRSKTNFVLVDRMYPDIDVDSVVTDHYEGAVKLTEYLIGKGHRKIGVLKGPGALFPDVERYRGFCHAMEKNKIAISLKFIHNCEFQEVQAFEAVKRMLEEDSRPTALFSFNSLMTIGAIKAIKAMKLRIPDDISLVCFDEIPGYEIFDPKITHVLQPIEDLGRAATKLLIEKIEHPNRKGRNVIYLKPELVIGDSCSEIGPPASGNNGAAI